MMNETGSYPGQAWLWLYALWYQVEPFKASENADLLVMLVMGVLSLAFICIPFIPVVNRIPRWIPIYKLIWREHYRAGAERRPPRRAASARSARARARSRRARRAWRGAASAGCASGGSRPCARDR